MSFRRRTSLVRVLDDLGTTLLDLLHGDASEEEIGGIDIYDPLDDAGMPQHALVLGIGIRDTAEVVALLAELGRHGAVGLVVRAPLPVDDAVRAAVERSGVALLGLTRGASWAQLAAMLRSLLAEGDVGAGEAETLGGMPSGDLFALANAVSALLDAPITIEDRSSRVVAFSGRQDEADPPRVETVLGRQVPERLARMLTERGVFSELYRSELPVYVRPLPTDGVEFTLSRVALAVRAGDEVLGSIWAAVQEELSEERTRAFCDVAKLVAIHMLQLRAGADVERRLRADLVGTALEGGAGAREALRRLGLADQPLVVLALGISDSGGLTYSHAVDADQESGRQRLGDGFAMHLSAVHPRSAAALIGDVTYALVPVSRPGGDDEGRVLSIATDFLDRISGRIGAVIGVGPVARDLAELVDARASADRALAALQTGNGTRRVARLSDVQVESLLLELRDLVASRGDRLTGPVARLYSYDVGHRSQLVETLRAWLDAFGDVAAAAASVYVHPNTFRYRLRRLAEIGRIDLDDPEARFAAMLQLRVLAPQAATTGVVPRTTG